MKERKTKKLIILLVGPLPPPTGGIATGVAGLLKSDLAREFKIVHVDNSTRRPVSKKGKIDILNAFSFILQISSLFIHILIYRPDIVQIETASGISFFKNSVFVLISKLMFRRVIISIHGGGFRDFFREIPIIGRRYVELILSKCDAVRVLSKGWADFFINEIGIEKEKVFSIPNGLNLNVFDQKSKPKRISKSPINLLFLGYVGRNKGIFDLLRSAGSLKREGHKFKLLIVGPEAEVGAINKAYNLIREEGIEGLVEVVGEKERSKAIEYYKTSHIYVLPSYNEGLPYGILEAMAAGLPIVSTPVGAIPEIIEEGINGFLVKPGDRRGLTAKIRILLMDESLRNEMGKRNRAKVAKEYSLGSVVGQFKRLYYHLLS